MEHFICSIFLLLFPMIICGSNYYCILYQLILKFFLATYKFRLYWFIWNMFTFPVAWNDQQMSRLGLFWKITLLGLLKQYQINKIDCSSEWDLMLPISTYAILLQSSSQWSLMSYVLVPLISNKCLEWGLKIVSFLYSSKIKCCEEYK